MHVWHFTYDWTTNPKKGNLTGDKRIVSIMYYGYKVVKDASGNYELVQSELVNSLEDLPSDFIYITERFYKKVYNYDLSIGCKCINKELEEHLNYDKQKDYYDLEPIESETLKQNKVKEKRRY
jgi:hypothetical protein